MSSNMRELTDRELDSVGGGHHHHHTTTVAYPVSVPYPRFEISWAATIPLSMTSSASSLILAK